MWGKYRRGKHLSIAVPPEIKNQLIRRNVASWKACELVPGAQVAALAVEFIGTPSDAL